MLIAAGRDCKHDWDLTSLPITYRAVNSGRVGLLDASNRSVIWWQPHDTKSVSVVALCHAVRALELGSAPDWAQLPTRRWNHHEARGCCTLRDWTQPLWKWIWPTCL